MPPIRRQRPDSADLNADRAEVREPAQGEGRDRERLRIDRVLQLPELRLNGRLAAAAGDTQSDLAAGWRARHAAREVDRILDRLVLEPEDDVAGLQPGRCGGRAGDDLGHQRAARGVELRGPTPLGGHRRDGDAQVAAHDLAVLLELAQDVLGEVHGDREPDTDGAARLREDGGVDAHERAPRVHERTARVARVHRGVGLDEVVVRATADEALLGADDAAGHRLLQTERVADGHHGLAHLEAVGVAERKRGQVAPLDLQQRDVGARVEPDDLRLVLAMVAQPYHDLVGVGDDVDVGDDVAVWRSDHARAEALAAARRLAITRAALEEPPEELVGQRAARLRLLRRGDVDDSRPRRLREIHPDAKRRGKLRLAALFLPERRGARGIGRRRIDLDRDHPGGPEGAGRQRHDQEQRRRPAHHAARR